MGRIITRGKWTAVTASVTNLSELDKPYIKWGIPAADPKGGQSGYEFVPVSAHAHLDGTECVLGKFIHHNWAVVMTEAMEFSAVLDIEVYFEDDRKVHPFQATFGHQETVNSPGYQDDIVTLPTILEPDFVHVDGVEYRVTITGFSRDGFTVPEFRSPEGESNDADIVARFEPTSSLGS
ncbi:MULTISPECIES: choice-of-anchor K domain-containing protein [unclassified Saccharothrix]|uniref:choice-of-anchor K domain-containing protein n=1 Tax=unclassified Saccharothrix TaxID=2593673 RepID=UPI00307F143D